MIYLITNTIDGKRYIGKTTKSLEDRWYQHCKNAEYGHNSYLYKAIRKHGAESFKVEKLCDGLDEEEVLMIETYSPEYNMTRGGDGGNTSSSPNWVRGMIMRRSYVGEGNPNYGKCGENSPNYGKKLSQEQKDKISESEYLKKKKRPVIFDNVHYESVQGAARAIGRSERYVRRHGKFVGNTE
jgi:group I intron endonuclease